MDEARKTKKRNRRSFVMKRHMCGASVAYRYSSTRAEGIRETTVEQKMGNNYVAEVQRKVIIWKQ